MTPHSLAFYVHVVATGTVLGLRPSDSPGRVATVLGPDFAENTFGEQAMFRDYGLAEFHFHRAHARDAWEGHHFSLQVHRLARRDRAIPGEVLRTRYGRFTPRLRFGGWLFPRSATAGGFETSSSGEAAADMPAGPFSSSCRATFRL